MKKKETSPVWNILYDKSGDLLVSADDEGFIRITLNFYFI